MASAFGHALAAIALGSTFKRAVKSPKFWLLGITCSVLPDIDVLAFQFGIPYEHPLGHRGFTHSILFAVLLAPTLSFIFFQQARKSARFFALLSFYLLLCTLSHAALDAMTTGGKGVGFLIPFDNSRYFFPFRPIKVSPIGVEQFLSEWGVKVLASEVIWIGIPCLILLIAMYLIRKLRQKT